MLTVLAATSATASAATKNGITPLAPKAGASVPAGKALTFRMKVQGAGSVFVHVCKSNRKDKDGVICRKATIGQAKKRNGVFQYKQKFYDFPEFWLNQPGRYYWQAYRIECTGGSDCQQEGPITRFRVG